MTSSRMIIDTYRSPESVDITTVCWKALHTSGNSTDSWKGKILYFVIKG